MKQINATNFKQVLTNKNKECDSCHKSSQILYESRYFRYCPRCKVEQLSYWFPKTKIGQVSFYLTEAIFHHLDDLGQKIKWTKVNDKVVLKIKKKFSILEKRKKQNQSTDLILIGNEILEESFKVKTKNLLHTRKCNKCEKQRYHLISPKCCERNFCCIYCWMDEKRKLCSLCGEENIPV
jgi:hypothetical protein